MFKVHYPHQAADALLRLELEQYQLISHLARKTDWIRLAAPVLALSKALFNVAIIVSSIVEPIIKGLANLFGSPFYANCHALKGLKLITIISLENILFGAFDLVGTPIRSVVALFQITINPISYSEYQVYSIEKILRKARAQEYFSR